MKCYTLVYLLRGGEVCLGKKARGRGAGYWNGFGGKVEAGETITAAAARELREECGVSVEETALTLVAQNEFHYPDEVSRVYTFTADRWRGEPEETDEMCPAWFSCNLLPFEEMWESDSAWLLRALRGECLHGTVRFDASGTKVLEMEWKSVQEISPQVLLGSELR